MDDKEVIYAYTRKQAIEDGVLVDVSEMAKEAGLTVPTALTRAVWSAIEDVPPASGQDVKGRLWDVLWMLVMKIHRTPNVGNLVFYKVLMDRASVSKDVLELKAVIGPGDEGEPVITIMLPEED